MKRSGMGSHESSHMLTSEWLTPPEILEALGPFDLDPCAPVNRPWDMAGKHYTVDDNGLIQQWAGRVWCNPPYGVQTSSWLQLLAHHGDGIALIFARTETETFFRHVWDKADAVLFIQGRLYFYHVNGQRATMNAGAPSCLVAYGQSNIKALAGSRIPGKLIRLKGGNHA